MAASMEMMPAPPSQVRQRRPAFAPKTLLLPLEARVVA